MKDDYIKFLTQKNILPLSNWKFFIADHSKEKIKNSRNEPHIYNIRNQGKKISGVYMYFDEDTCLYVGESSNLGDRFKDHYNESWKKQKLSGKNKQFLFFEQFRKKLKVLWINIDDYNDRLVIESMLTRIYQPIYIDFRLKINT